MYVKYKQKYVTVYMFAYNRGRQPYVTHGPIFLGKIARGPHNLEKTFKARIYYY